jgi:hypothetical protein
MERVESLSMPAGNRFVTRVLIREDLPLHKPQGRGTRKTKTWA